MSTPARGHSSPPHRRVRNAAALAVLLTSLWSAAGALDSSDAQIRLRAAEQIVTQGRLVVASHGSLGEGSMFRDTVGLYPSRFGIGQSLFFVPFVAIARPLAALAPVPDAATRHRVSRFLLATPVYAFVLLGVFALCVINAKALGAGPVAAYFAAFVGVLGSSFWQMAKQGQEENQLAIAALLALYGWLQWMRTGRVGQVWLSAISVSVAVMFRPTAFLLVLGVVGLYGVETLRSRRSVWQVALPFVVAGAGALAVVLGFNLFKTGHPLRFGYAAHEGGFGTSTWWQGVWGSTVGLDRGIFWQNLWLLPATLLVALNWRRLRPELRTAVAFSGFLFLSSVALHAAWTGWAGGSLNYGTRFQQHVVPLLALTLILGSLESLAGLHRWVTQWTGAVALAAAVLQLPSVALVHNLEGMQAMVAGATAPAGQVRTVGMGGMLRLRLENVASKLTTGSTVAIDTLRSHPFAGILPDVSRWDFWPWRLDKYFGPGATSAARIIWFALLLSSLASWAVVFRRARHDAAPG